MKDNKELHHLMGYNLARAIIITQIGSPTTEKEHLKLHNYIKALHRKKGNMSLSTEEHKKMDAIQEELINLIKKSSLWNKSEEAKQ